MELLITDVVRHILDDEQNHGSRTDRDKLKQYFDHVWLLLSSSSVGKIPAADHLSKKSRAEFYNRSRRRDFADAKPVK